MEILFAINKKFIQHFYVTVQSLLKNIQNELLVINVMHVELDKKDIEEIERDYPTLRFKWYDLNQYDFSEFYINAHINYETYFRIIAPEILNVDKVLYLDSDLLIRRDIKELYETDLKSYSVGAIYDFKAQDRKRALGIPDDYNYFNAGVLLMNLNYWRKNNITDRLINFIVEKNNQLLYWDQDALNAILYENVKFVADEWNVQSASFESEHIKKSVLKNPGIIHFTGATKPWHISCENEFKGEYFEHLKSTPFQSFCLIEDSVADLMRRKKKLYIWGTGPTGAKVYEYLNQEIEGFLDSNEEKVGTYFIGKLTLGIEQIEGQSDIGIIVCSGYYKDIAKKLLEHGYKEDEDFVHQM